MFPYLKSALSLSAGSLILLFFMQPGLAFELGELSARPASPNPRVEHSDKWFIYQLAAGSVYEDRLLVQNSSQEALHVLLYPADSRSDSDGGFALAERGVEMTGLGRWIRFFGTPAPEPDEDASASFYEAPGDLNSVLGRCAVLDIPGGQDAESIEAYHASRLRRNLSGAELGYLANLAVWCQGAPEHELQLEAQSQLEIPFIISIPADANAGEHTGGLLLERLSATGAEQADGFNPRVAVRIYEMVPGEIVQQLELSEFRFEPESGRQNYNIALVLNNSGNISLDAAVRVTVADLINETVIATLERPVQILRDSSLTTELEWTPPLWGRFGVQAEVKYQANEEAQTVQSSEIKLWVIPWPLIIGILVGLVVLVFIFKLWLRSRIIKAPGAAARRGASPLRQQAWVRYRVGRGENLEDVAQKVQVPWKRLALANKLPKPYTLNDGQTILVPSRMRRPELAGDSRSGSSSAKKEVKRIVLVIALILLAVIVILAILIKPKSEDSQDAEFMKERVMEQQAEMMTEKLIEEESAPQEPEVVEELVDEVIVVEPADVSLSILNGSGLPGAAGRLGIQLRDIGYIVDATANADNFDYTKTVIRYVTGNEPKVELLVASLEELGFKAEAEEVGDGEGIIIILGAN